MTDLKIVYRVEQMKWNAEAKRLRIALDRANARREYYEYRIAVLNHGPSVVAEKVAVPA
jgi:hypothetical protein